MNVLYICTKQLSTIATSVFDHEGAIVLPTSIRAKFDNHPVLRRVKHTSYPPVSVRINGTRYETARLNRVGVGDGQYQLRLCDEATEGLKRMLADELRCHQIGWEVNPFTLLSVFWNDTAAEFVITISRN